MTSGAICHLSRRITGACSAEIRVRRGGQASLLCCLPRRIAGRQIFFFLLAKTQRRKEMVERSV
jgi:hypothetical protein